MNGLLEKLRRGAIRALGGYVEQRLRATVYVAMPEAQGGSET